MFIVPFFVYDDTLTSNNILFEVMSCYLSINFDCPIICKTVKYSDQSDNSCWYVLGFDTSSLSRINANW